MLTDKEYSSYSSLVEMNSTEIDNNKNKKRASRTIFGSYQLLRTIGEGEFGKVKLGIKINTQSAVAIKLIKKKSVYNQNKLTKLCQEISILEKVNHPYIIKTYEVIEDNDYIGIIMEYASGGELFEYILAHRYLEEYEAKRFFAQLLSGINYLHKNHLVHRDLKLENLLLDSIHNIVITDFGFATESHSDENKFLTTSCGSPCYAAPELVVNDGYVGEAADIWSCGVILYAMICGYLPFDDDPNNPDGENIHLLYKYILETKVNFPDYVSEEAKDLLRGILDPDPGTRFTMNQIINHPWIRDFKEFILIEYDENNEAIIPTYEEMPENMKVMADSNPSNIKTLASLVFSSTSSSTTTPPELCTESNDSQVPDTTTNDEDSDNEEDNENDASDSSDSDDDDNSRNEDEDYFMDVQNGVLPDISTIDSDQYIDFIKQSDCETTTSNFVNSEASDFNPPPPMVIKKDSYYTAQSMDLNQTSSIMNESIKNGIDGDDEDNEGELDIPMLSMSMNPPNFNNGDNITIPDSISNYYTDQSEILSTAPYPSNNKLTIPNVNIISDNNSDEDNFLEKSSRTVTENDKKNNNNNNNTSNEKKNSMKSDMDIDIVLSSGGKDDSISPIYAANLLDNSLEEVTLPSTVNNQSKIAFNRISLQPKPRISSLPDHPNHNNPKGKPTKEEDKTSSILSQTVVETSHTKIICENPETNSTVVINGDLDGDDKKRESQCLSKLESLSLVPNKDDHNDNNNNNNNDNNNNDNNKSFISDRKSIVSDRKSIRSRKDLSHMNLENIKVSRSNISLSSRRLSTCTNSTANTSIANSTPFYTPSISHKRLSSINTSFNDISMDSLHPMAAHSSFILTSPDAFSPSSSDMKRYSLNAYKQNRNSLRVPASSSFILNTSSKLSISTPPLVTKPTKEQDKSTNNNNTSNNNNNNNKNDKNNTQTPLNTALPTPATTPHKGKEDTDGPIMILDELKKVDHKLSDSELNIVENSSSASEEEHPLKTEINSTSQPSPSAESKPKDKINEGTNTTTTLVAATTAATAATAAAVDATTNAHIVTTTSPTTGTVTATTTTNTNSNDNADTNSPIEHELISPKNPYIKYFNGIIDSKALTITPPFVTFLEMQKTLIAMDIEYKVLNNCFKIRCQKIFNSIDTPEDLEAIGKGSPGITPLSPLHTPVHIPSSSSSTTNLSSPPHQVNGNTQTLPNKSSPLNKSKKSISDEVLTTASPSVKATKTNDDQVSGKCYSFHSHGSTGKFKSFVNSIRDCAKPSSNSNSNNNNNNNNNTTPSTSPTTINRRVSEPSHQKRLFSLIKRKKNQSLVIFTMEICRIKNRDELYIIKFKRRKGDVWLFKDLYQQILSRLPLRT